MLRNLFYTTFLVFSLFTSVFSMEGNGFALNDAVKESN